MEVKGFLYLKELEMPFDRILVLGPHTDDGEIGCGGLISRFRAEEKIVWYATFSFAKKSIPPKFAGCSTKKEVYESAAILGIDKDHIITFDFDTRNFPAFRQEILEEMIKLKRFLLPNVIILPSTYDTHQDHQVIRNEGFRAFKQHTLLGFEVLQNNLLFSTNVFVKLEQRHIICKIKAVECYKSQEWRGSLDLIEPLAQIRGRQSGTEYAECFEAIRWIF